jgi:hypothetical protein
MNKYTNLIKSLFNWKAQKERHQKKKELASYVRYVGQERYTLVGSDRVLMVHNRSRCQGQHCCIHNPSDHHMRDWPQNWRGDRNIMERICPHGIGHPDPDDPKSKIYYESVHGCDGCCHPPTK